MTIRLPLLARQTSVAFWVLANMPFLACAHPDTGPRVIESFPVDGDCSLIIIPVMIKDAEYAFAVDTGCAVTLLDASFKAALVPARARYRVNGDLIAQTYHTPFGHVGDSLLALPEQVACVDLADIRSATGEDIRGVLGMDFLSKYALRLRLHDRRIELLTSSGGLTGDKCRLMIGEDQCPRIDVTLPKIGKTSFTVCTGFAGFTNGQLDKTTL